MTAGTRTPTRKVVTAVIGIMALIVVANLLARALDVTVGGSKPSGEPGSSFATSNSGLAAYAQLLAEYGHPVQRVRGELADALLDPLATLIVTAPAPPATIDAQDLEQIRTFVEQGGRAVLAEFGAFELQVVAGVAPETIAGVRVYRDVEASFGAVREVRTDGVYGYDTGADLSALVREGDNALLVASATGVGDVLMLADAAPIQNEFIGEADNAGFGLALPGAAERPVVFAEGVHGYGERTGFAAIPDRWKFALLALGAAGVVFAWARGRRLGPADQPTRTLPPARAAYVDALAGTLARTADRPSSLAHLGAWARDRVKQRAGLPADADQEAVATAARQLGLDDDEIVALWQPPTTDEAVIALGRVVSRVTDERT